MRLFSLVIFAYAIVLMACDTQQKSCENLVGKGSFITKRISIPIDSSLLPFYNENYVWQANEQDDGYYYGLNSSGNQYSIDVFDIRNQSFHKKIKISVSDTSEIRRVAGFKVVSKDSIYLLENFPKVALYLINENGQLLRSWVVLKQNPDHEEGLYVDDFASGSTGFILSDDKNELVLFCSSDHDSDSYESYQHAPLVKFNLTTYKFTVFGEYPELYKNDRDLYYPFAQEPFVCFSDSLFYVSFMQDSRVRVYDIKTLELEELKCIVSLEIDNIPNRISREKDFQSQSNFQAEFPFYKHLVYDRYSNTIFRFAKLGQSLYQEGTKLNHIMNARHSVIVNNLTTNSFKEFIFSGNTYIYNVSPVARGFILSNFNTFNPQVTEDSLVLTRFVIE